MAWKRTYIAHAQMYKQGATIINAATAQGTMLTVDNNSDFGLSELQWELRKPNGEIKREIFHLIKFNGDLPPDNGEGYHLLAPPTPATFRDKLIEVLPPEVIEKSNNVE